MTKRDEAVRLGISKRPEPTLKFAPSLTKK